MSVHHWPRLVSIAAMVAVSVLQIPPVSAQPAPPLPLAPGAASPLPAEPVWVFNLEPAAQRDAPDAASEPVAQLRKFSYLEVKGYDGEWAQVLNPRTGIM